MNLRIVGIFLLILSNVNTSFEYETTDVRSDYDDEDDYYSDYNGEERVNDQDDDYDNDYNSNQVNRDQPYNCPLQCKCQFVKNRPDPYYDEDKDTLSTDSESSTDAEFDYSTEYDRPRLRRQQTDQINNSRLHGDDYDDDYNDYDDTYDADSSSSSGQKSSPNGSVRHSIKYDIIVDCSGQNLHSIGNLFDYDFPLERIVNL